MLEAVNKMLRVWDCSKASLGRKLSAGLATSAEVTAMKPPIAAVMAYFELTNCSTHLFTEVCI